jgi:hypothetical protein
MSNNTCLNFNDFFKTSDSGKTRSSTEAKINLPKARSNIKNTHSLPDQSRIGMKFREKFDSQKQSALTNTYPNCDKNSMKVPIVINTQ